MTQQTINTGTVANDATGDPLQTAGTKINANFTELYGALAGVAALGATVVQVTAGVIGAAAANTLAIQNALNTGGQVLIPTPGIVYISPTNSSVNGILIYSSNSRVVVGPNTTIEQVPVAAPKPLWISKSLNTRLTSGGTTVAILQGGSGIWNLTSTTGGTGYANGTRAGVSITGGSGSGALATVTITAGAVSSIYITYPGHGYVAGDSVGIGLSTGGSAYTTTVSTLSVPTALTITYTAHGLNQGDGIWLWSTSASDTPYAGVFRVSTVNDANTLTIFTQRAPSASPVGTIKATPAVRNFHLQGGDHNYNYSGGNNQGWINIYDQNGIYAVGLIDSSFEDLRIMDAGPDQPLYIQAVNNIRLVNIGSYNNSADTISLFGPAFNVYADSLANATDDDGFIIIPCEDSSFAADQIDQFGGDILNVHVKGISSTGTVNNAVANVSQRNAQVRIYPNDLCWIDNIVLEDINLATTAIFISVDTTTGQFAHGYIRNLTIRNVFTTGFGTANCYGINFGQCEIDNLFMEQMSFSPTTTTVASNNNMITSTAATIIRNAVFRKILVDGFPTTSGFSSLFNMSGVFGRLTFSDAFIRSGVGSYGFLNLGGGAVTWVAEQIVIENGFFDPNVTALVLISNAPAVGAITTQSISSAGTGLTNGSFTNVSLTGGSGSGAKATVVVSGGAVTQVAITAPGSGYSHNDSLTAAGIGAGWGITVGAVSIAPAFILKTNDIQCTNCINTQASAGSFEVHLQGNTLYSVGGGVIRNGSGAGTVTLRSAGDNSWLTGPDGPSVPVQSFASMTLKCYGWDIPIAPFGATSALPGGSGTLSIAAGQFITSTSAGANMSGPAVSTGSANPWWALATNAGANVNITS